MDPLRRAQMMQRIEGARLAQVQLSVPVPPNVQLSAQQLAMKINEIINSMNSLAQEVERLKTSGAVQVT